jgi:outer membrane lipoprotein-sorting protein
MTVIMGVRVGPVMIPFFLISCTSSPRAVDPPVKADPLAKYESFMKSHPALEVDFKMSINGKEVGQGTMKIKRPGLMLFKSSGDGFNYTLSITPNDYLELENKEADPDTGQAFSRYDEFPSQAKLEVYDSEISPLGNATIPGVLLSPNLKEIFADKYDSTQDGTSTVLHRKFQGFRGPEETWATIDEEGKITVLKRKITRQQGTQELDWKFGHYSVPSDVSLKAFQAFIPAGYKAYTVPRLKRPLAIGETAPTQGWKLHGKTVDLVRQAHNKPFLLVYAQPGSLPADRALAWLDGIKGKVPTFIIGQDGLSDPDGTRVEELAPPGSPMFYLIGSNGKVEKLWFGFDPDRPAGFRDDVLRTATP